MVTNWCSAHVVYVCSMSRRSAFMEDEEELPRRPDEALEGEVYRRSDLLQLVEAGIGEATHRIRVRAGPPVKDARKRRRAGAPRQA